MRLLIRRLLRKYKSSPEAGGSYGDGSEASRCVVAKRDGVRSKVKGVTVNKLTGGGSAWGGVAGGAWWGDRHDGANPSGTAPFGGGFSDPPTQAEMEAFASYVETLRGALVR